ncbi:hypothetical protein M9Y10_018698 [Tritrichomonas musculus]|uniref:Protein kinase domain-containing protein n=1 Tax=Tritrichomonas musculus TaxID=1915356 RepID=A0ABR2HMD3_9EUKA
MTQPQIKAPSTITYTNNNGIKNVFVFHEKLGQGGFAAVYRATLDNSSKNYAIKIIPKEQYDSSKRKSLLEKLKNETHIQKKLNHKNIVQLKLSFEDETNHYIVLEYCPGKSVRDFLRKNLNGHLSEPETRKIINDVIEGLCFLHNRRIIHHDLKLENLLIGSDGKVKIADFGLATILNNEYEDDKKHPICGTPNYMSPEIITKKNTSHGFEVDVWAIGVATFIMLTGKPPFDGGGKEMTYENIKNCNYQFPTKIQISSEAKDFIRTILKIDPHKRPTAIDLIDHPFLTKFDKEKVQLYKLTQKVCPLTPPPQKVQSNLYYYLSRNTPSANNFYSDSNKEMTPTRVRSFSNLSSPNYRSPILSNYSSPISDENDSSFKNSYLSNVPVTYENNESSNSSSNAISKNFVVPSYVVTKHCVHADYLAYLLGDGTVGLCYEDRSRIVIDPNEKFVQFYKNQNAYAEVINVKNIDGNIKENIKNKISQVKKYAKSFKKFQYLYELPSNDLDSNSTLPNVKSFSRNDSSFLFKFNNKNIQVNFGDYKKLLIFWNTKKICFFRVIKEKCQLMDLNDVANMNSNCEEIEKFKKAKELLSVYDKIDLGL